MHACSATQELLLQVCGACSVHCHGRCMDDDCNCRLLPDHDMTLIACTAAVHAQHSADLTSPHLSESRHYTARQQHGTQPFADYLYLVLDTSISSVQRAACSQQLVVDYATCLPAIVLLASPSPPSLPSPSPSIILPSRYSLVRIGSSHLNLSTPTTLSYQPVVIIMIIDSLSIRRFVLIDRR